MLLSAFASAAEGGSEVAIGWNLARHLAAFHDVTLLCTPWIGTEDFRSRNDAFLRREGPVKGLTIRYIEPPLLSRALQHGHMGFCKPFYYLGYASWQWAAYREAVRLHRQKPFDIAHQLNITGYREPGYLWKMGIPFAWGPIGGAADFPANYLSLLRPADRVLCRLRNIVNTWQRRFASRPREAAQRASKIWTIGPENRQMVERLWGRPAEMLCESGAAGASSNDSRTPYDASRPLHLVWSGLFVGRKAMPLFLHALARLPDSVNWQATIIGDGPGRNHAHELAAQLGIQSRIRWTGSLPHAEAVRELSRGDVLVFTSLQEGTPLTILEALGVGLPVVCHNVCGMGVVVDDSCGIRVTPGTIESSVEGFSHAIARLAAEPYTLRRLSHAAMQRAEEFSWRSIARRIAEGYEAVLTRPGRTS